MVFFNYTTMQVSAKIVYYGPGLCGKTTNLHQIHARTDPGSRGEMVSLETEADRTLFFDLLPLEVGTIGGMRVRLQLYTVPGQVFYNTTRKLVLKGVDGIVFVADSQEVALEANIESFQNLKQNLEELNQPIEKIPFIFQYNKRDLRNILSAEALDRHLNHGGYEVVEAAALHGVGVFETLRMISKKTLAAVHRKISGGDRPEPAPSPPPAEVEPVQSAIETAESETVTMDSLDAGTPSESLELMPPSEGVFVELDDESKGTSPSLGETLPEPPPPPAATTELGPEASTAEVKIEFAAKDQAEDPGAAAATGSRAVATQSRRDIERELAKLRELAFPSGRTGRPGGSGTKATTVTEARARAAVPEGTLDRATGLLVDLRLVGEGFRHTVTGAVRMELPSDQQGSERRLRLLIDLDEKSDETGE